MSYKAVKAFRDLQDNKRYYATGDVFPRQRLSVSDERLGELENKGLINWNGAERKAIDLDTLKKDELIALAKKHNVEVATKDNKEDIIQKLTEV